MMTYSRDPHLPPPEVCDWLLEHRWSGCIPKTLILYPDGAPHGITQSELLDYETAHAAIGADEIARVFLSDEALTLLHEDRTARRIALDQKRAASLDDTLSRKREHEHARVCEMSEHVPHSLTTHPSP
jgi:hypothetical protein